MKYLNGSMKVRKKNPQSKSVLNHRKQENGCLLKIHEANNGCIRHYQ